MKKAPGCIALTHIGSLLLLRVSLLKEADAARAN